MSQDLPVNIKVALIHHSRLEVHRGSHNTKATLIKIHLTKNSLKICMNLHFYHQLRYLHLCTFQLIANTDFVSHNCSALEARLQYNTERDFQQ